MCVCVKWYSHSSSVSKDLPFAHYVVTLKWLPGIWQIQNGSGANNLRQPKPKPSVAKTGWCIKEFARTCYINEVEKAYDQLERHHVPHKRENSSRVWSVRRCHGAVSACVNQKKWRQSVGNGALRLKMRPWQALDQHRLKYMAATESLCLVHLFEFVDTQMISFWACFILQGLDGKKLRMSGPGEVKILPFLLYGFSKQWQCSWQTNQTTQAAYGVPVASWIKNYLFCTNEDRTTTASCRGMDVMSPFKPERLQPINEFKTQTTFNECCITRECCDNLLDDIVTGVHMAKVKMWILNVAETIISLFECQVEKSGFSTHKATRYELSSSRRYVVFPCISNACPRCLL